MIEGIVISLEILGLSQGMDYRGSKSDSLISVKEQRADGSSIFSRYCKVCSECQGNLVFIYPTRYVNTVISTAPYLRTPASMRNPFGVWARIKGPIGVAVGHGKSKNILYSNITQKSFFSSEATSLPSGLLRTNTSLSTLNPNYVTGFTDGEGCFLVVISPDSKFKTGYRVKATFQIGLHEKDFALLEQIKLFFGVGQITKLGAESKYPPRGYLEYLVQMI
jgi:hypothetical protein